MRNLSIQATPWQPSQSAEMPRLALGESLVSLDECRFDDWHYQRLLLERKGERFCYLYADQGRDAWVLGVFDTPGQAEFFLALHNDNPLKVPALKLNTLAPAVRIEQGMLVYPHYVGVYRVGFKSYLVERAGNTTMQAQYIDRYKTQMIGEGGEKEMCLAVYSHFDARLRGCKMC